MRGSKVDDATEVEFREHYLLTGNATSAAHAVGLKPSTGRELARRANETPEFAEARREMYARALPDAERMMMSSLEVAMKRLVDGPVDPKVLAALGAEKINIQDPCPAYFKGIVDAFKALTAHRRFDAERSGEISGEREVVIRIGRTESVDVVPT